MKTKHKLLKDFQYISDDKRIFTLKKGITLEEYVYDNQGEPIVIDKEVVDANTDFFQEIDWKAELIKIIKSSKVPQPTTIAKKIMSYIEDDVFSSTIPTDLTELKIVEELKKRIVDLEIELETRPNRFNMEEIDNLEKDYYERVKNLRAKEMKLNEDSDSLIREKHKLELENETNKMKLSRMEERLNEQKVDIERRESDLKIKMDEARQLEEKVRDMEAEVKKREREIDGTLLSSEKDIQDKQKEVYDKIKSEMKELEDKEREYNVRIKALEDREKQLDKMQEKITDDRNTLDDKIRKAMEKAELEINRKESIVLNRELEYMSRVRDIKSLLETIYSSVPWGVVKPHIKEDMLKAIQIASS